MGVLPIGKCSVKIWKVYIITLSVPARSVIVYNVINRHSFIYLFIYPFITPVHHKLLLTLQLSPTQQIVGDYFVIKKKKLLMQSYSEIGHMPVTQRGDEKSKACLELL